MPRPSTLGNQSLLTAALEGLEIQRQRIEEQIREVKAMLGQRGPGRPRASEAAAPPAVVDKKAKPRRKRKLSAEARKRIAEAQKQRWAAYRKAAEKKS